MQIAQKLYEGIELGKEGSVGLITYMRTDSTRVAESALSEAREFITGQYGPQYLPEKAIHYRSKKDAAGRARSDPPDFGRAHAGIGRALSRQGSARALPPDLATIRRLANDAGDLRSNDD